MTENNNRPRPFGLLEWSVFVLVGLGFVVLALLATMSPEERAQVLWFFP